MFELVFIRIKSPQPYSNCYDHQSNRKYCPHESTRQLRRVINKQISKDSEEITGKKCNYTSKIVFRFEKVISMLMGWESGLGELI